MGKPSPRLLKFMETYKVDADEVWEVRTGGAWAIKHSALERVAAEQGITYDLPQISEKDSANKIVAMLVVAHMGDRVEWSFGEASPANNKNAYCYAMAEKRAKDRCILKLLNSHGSVYSESEADEFAHRPNPHTTKPSDLVPEVEYDQHGQPIDNIPTGDDRIERLPKAKARNDFAVAQHELRLTKTPTELERWGKANANRVESYPTDWQALLRGIYTDHMADLRNVKQKEVA
jgi:hypothetical protein